MCGVSDGAIRSLCNLIGENMFHFIQAAYIFREHAACTADNAGAKAEDIRMYLRVYAYAAQ